MAEPEARDGPAVRTGRIAELVHRELALCPTCLTNHREPFELSRIRVCGRCSLGSLFCSYGFRLLLLLVEFADV